MTTSAPHGKAITIFLAEGRPDGLRVIERSNRTGVVLVSGVANPVALLARPQLSGPGVYLLVGGNEDGLSQLYIGESENVGNRIQQHLRNAVDTWQQIVVASRNDRSLNKAHARWLEHRLIALARAARRSTLSNANSGSASSLHEIEVATLEEYLEDFLTILPLLGIDFFEVAQVPLVSESGPLFHLRGAGGVDAEGYEIASGFIVTAGTTRPNHTPTTTLSTTRLRERLLASGIFTVGADGLWTLSAPYTFESPSMAASVMLGRSANGLTEWKTADNESLKSIREADVETIA